MASVSRLKRYVFYHIYMEVKEKYTRVKHHGIVVVVVDVFIHQPALFAGMGHFLDRPVRSW